MTKYNTIPNDDEALLAPKKQKSFKGLVFGAAAASLQRTCQLLQARKDRPDELRLGRCELHDVLYLAVERHLAADD